MMLCPHANPAQQWNHEFHINWQVGHSKCYQFYNSIMSYHRWECFKRFTSYIMLNGIWFYGDNMIYQKAIQQNINLCSPQAHQQ